jgi:hypothetical protein
MEFARKLAARPPSHCVWCQGISSTHQWGLADAAVWTENDYTYRLRTFRGSEEVTASFLETRPPNWTWS